MKAVLARSFAAGLLAISLLVAFTTTALAWSPATEGDPGLTHEMPTGYYLWRDDNGLHLRTHGPDEEHLFTARLWTDGTFTDVDAVRLESRDDFAVIDGGHTLVLRFHTYDATDGVNFRIRGGSRLRLALKLDGEYVETESIFLGARGIHPRTNPFTIKR